MALSSAAIDYSQLTRERNAVSNALDAAVLAAANNNAIPNAQKDTYAEAHFTANYKGDLDLTLHPSVNSERVRLAATGQLGLLLGGVVGADDPVLTEASAATLSSQHTICALALSETEDGAITFDRDLEFLASQCAVHANSNSSKAIVAERNLTAPTASSSCAVGGISGEVEPHSKGECGVVSDPYANVPSAKFGVCKEQLMFRTMTTTTFGNRGNGIGNGNGNGKKGPKKKDLITENPNTLTSTSGSVSLPAVNPLSAKDIQDLLDNKFDKHTFHGEDCSLEKDGNVDENSGIERREGNTEKIIEKVSALGGEDMRQLLAAYDAYGGQLDCGDDFKAVCSGFNNPFIDADYDDVPSQWIVAEIFEMSYGSFLEEPEVVPEIVTNGTVEFISGQMFS